VNSLSGLLAVLIVSFSSAHRAAPKASKKGASPGMISPGISRCRYSTIMRFRVVPPMIMMLRCSTRFNSSIILSAIIRQSPAVTFDLGMPLLVAWVQSDLQNTEQRPDT